MPLLTDWKLTIEADQVLRAQGADPVLIRLRRPNLVCTAEWAVKEGLPLLEPAVLYVEFPIRELRHERVYLSLPDADPKPGFLDGALLANHLAGAERVVISVCTIGDAVETAAVNLIKEDILQGLALDALGSAAAESLENAMCAYLETQAEKDGLQATLPLSPGMIDWSVAKGQPQIFRLLETERKKHPSFKVALTKDCVMLPRKSVSFVIGLGVNVNKKGRTCDFCAMRETCRYQDHYV
jgi:hypothetical protein